ncbi:hypothetical protein HMPREF9446_02818 [Bacteroides fluxus YIT 12057]|uniref:Uncharacterized protein n=1 Tax=Bacteroides fluxus YIT 12057 TaxID=763034 RepID=F3PVP1_9BACE|nr:hypothetical protein HMPREF9446_03406 [Bacteroides fluxus YIT 12057]EGF54096.1 hypothetical protein HMPREF9446_02818 [Bacteroides fluxus YIT 12057]
MDLIGSSYHFSVFIIICATGSGEAARVPPLWVASSAHYACVRDG